MDKIKSINRPRWAYPIFTIQLDISIKVIPNPLKPFLPLRISNMSRKAT